MKTIIACILTLALSGIARAADAPKAPDPKDVQIMQLNYIVQELKAERDQSNDTITALRVQLAIQEAKKTVPPTDANR